MSYIYGGDTGLTYEEMRKRREQSEQMRAISDKIMSSQQTPTTFGGGLSAIGQALIARQKGKKADALDAEADAAEKAGRSNASSVFQSILGGGAMSGQPQPASYTPRENVDQGDPRRGAFGAGPSQERPVNFDSVFYSAEQQYNLPSGYLSRTAQIESSGNPNAKNPNSSAGGLFQFIDSTAKQYGLSDKNDPMASTDAAARLASDNAAILRKTLGREPTAAELYLAHQQGGGGAAKLLSNPTARAVSIVGSDAVRLNGGDESMTAGQFASKWLNKFDSGGQPQQGRQQGVQVAQNGPGVEQIMAAMSNPYMSQEQKSALGILLQQKMQESDPMRQMQLEKGQLELQQMRQPANRPLPSGAAELEWRAKQAGLQPGSPEYQAFMLNGSGDPATFRALKLQALDAGLKEGTKEYEDFMASRGAFEQSYSRQAGTNQAQVDSGRQASSAVAAGTVEGRMEAETQAAAGSDMRAGLNALDLLNSIRNDPSREIATGKSSVLGKIPGTGAYDFTKKVEQAKSGAFMTAIQQMRGMGALSNAEGQTATAAVTRMSTSLTEEGFLEALDDYEKIIQQGVSRAEQNGAIRPAGQQSGPSDFSGASMTDLLAVDIMTLSPEQEDAWEARMKELKGAGR